MATRLRSGPSERRALSLGKKRVVGPGRVALEREIRRSSFVDVWSERARNREAAKRRERESVVDGAAELRVVQAPVREQRRNRRSRESMVGLQQAVTFGPCANAHGLAHGFAEPVAEHEEVSRLRRAGHEQQAPPCQLRARHADVDGLELRGARQRRRCSRDRDVRQERSRRSGDGRASADRVAWGASGNYSLSGSGRSARQSHHVESPKSTSPNVIQSGWTAWGSVSGDTRAPATTAAL